VQQAGALSDGRGLHPARDTQLARMLLTCTLAVLGLMYSSAAIWASLRPAARLGERMALRPQVPSPAARTPSLRVSSTGSEQHGPN
jgi:hypothetical protein